MVTPTLFNITTITDLRLTGDSFDPNEKDEDTIYFNTRCASFTNTLKTIMTLIPTKCLMKNTLLFLALWLSRCIFYCKSMKVDKIYLTLANQLHEEHDICLS